MYALNAQNLSKEFKSTRRSKQFFGLIKSRKKTKQQFFRAVDQVNIQLQQGDAFGFVGPNGAGKSTTIKLLTGILQASTGSVEIFGQNPFTNRKIIAKKMSVVFGQRSQLWFHLSPLHSFKLLASIYNIEKVTFKKTLDQLVEMLDVSSFINERVRCLSLGQRMRCELIASLLHRPDILFLDEPTIGLDVVAKSSIRQFIRHLCKKEGVTVFLTSHDTDDIESICDKLAIIDSGRIIYDGGIETLKSRYGASFSAKLKMVSPIPAQVIEDIEKKGIQAQQKQDVLSLEGKQQAINHAITQVLQDNIADDIQIIRPNLEAIMANIYSNPELMQ